jgi:hypothetical protein
MSIYFARPVTSFSTAANPGSPVAPVILLTFAATAATMLCSCKQKVAASHSPFSIPFDHHDAAVPAAIALCGQ